MSNFLSLFLALIIAAITYGTPLLFGMAPAPAAFS